MTEFVRREFLFDEEYVREQFNISPNVLIAGASWDGEELTLNVFVPLEEA